MENKSKINPFIHSLFQNIDSSGFTYDPLTTSLIQGYHLITRNTNTKAHTRFNSNLSFRNIDSKRPSFKPMTINRPKHFQSSVNSNFHNPVKNQNTLLTPERYLYYFKPISDHSQNQRFYKSSNQTSDEQIMEPIEKFEKISQENMIFKQPNLYKKKEFISGNNEIPADNLTKFVSENVRIKKLLIRPTIEENKLRLSLKNKQNLKQSFNKDLNDNYIYSYEQSNLKTKAFKTMEKSNFSKFKENRMQKPEDDRKMLKNQNKTEQELQRQRSEILIDLIANEKLMKQNKLMQQKFDNINFTKGDLSPFTKKSHTYCNRVPVYENLISSYNQNLNNNYHHCNKANTYYLTNKYVSGCPFVRTCY